MTAKAKKAKAPDDERVELISAWILATDIGIKKDIERRLREITKEKDNG